MAAKAKTKSAGSGFWWTLLFLVLLLAMAVAFLGWYLSRGPGEDAALVPLSHERGVRELAGTRGVVLFLLDGQGEAADSRQVQLPSRGSAELDVMAVLEALCDVNADEPGRAALPRGAVPTGVFIDQDEQQLVIDWTSQLVSSHPGGSAAEQATLSVILRTMAWNFPEFESCVLLVGGAPVETLGGHLDVSRPFDLRRWR